MFESVGLVFFESFIAYYIFKKGITLASKGKRNKA